MNDLVAGLIQQLAHAVARYEAEQIRAGCAVCGAPVTTRLTRPAQLSANQLPMTASLVVDADRFVCDQHADRWPT